jgi:hypothetical protein
MAGRRIRVTPNSQDPNQAVSALKLTIGHALN